MAGFTLTVAMRAQVTNLIAGTRDAAAQMRTFADRTEQANRSLAQLDANSARTAAQFAAIDRSARAAVTGLNRISASAGLVRGGLRAAGEDGERSVSRLQRTLAGAGRYGSSMTGLLAGGALFLGGEEMVKEGNRYQQEMNTFRAATGATAEQMKTASSVSQQLGNDLKLPGVTAADSAEALVDLSRAGFTADQSLAAVRASVQLSAATNVNAATSAKILGDTMDQFGLGADQASKAADTLAATSTKASGNITDIYYAMRYAGPVAHGLGVSLQDTAAGIAMLGKSGILGSTAGTSLRGMFAALAAPTPQSGQALKELGIDAYDAQGRFLGLRNVIDGLSKAQRTMSEGDFTAAVTKAFGRPALSGVVALAHQGVQSFDALSMAVDQTGTAATLTAARGQGLNGAMTQLRTQAQQTGLALYNGMAPGLEYVARLLTRGMSGATPYLTSALQYGRELAQLYGPELKAKAGSGMGELINDARQLLGPLKAIGENTLAAGLNLLINAARALGTVGHNLEAALAPVASSLAGVGKESGGAASELDIVVLAVNGALHAVAGLSAVLVPVGHVVGALVSDFSELPAPIQSSVLALLLFRRAQPALSGFASTVSGPVLGAVRGFNEEMQLQRSLAESSGVSLTRYGAAWAAIQARVGFLGNMTSAFRSADGAGRTFVGTLGGVTRAAGSGLKSAMSGLSGAMGGPWGVALAGVTVGLGLLAEHQQKAAEAAAEHQQRISTLTSALKESGGVIDANVRAQAAQTLMDTKVRDGKDKLVDVMEKAGVPMARLTDAYLGQGTSLDALQKQLNATAEANTTFIATQGGAAKAYNDTGLKAAVAADALGSVKGEMAQSMKNARDLADAERGAGDGTSAYDKLKAAVGGLADETADADQRTRSLKDALDLLSGGQISLQAARAKVNSAVLDLKDSDTNVDRSQGYGAPQLVNSDDTLNTTTRNGQQLYTQLTALSDAAADASVATYSLAQQNGETLPAALAKARDQMSQARDAAIKAAQGYGLTREQAEKVADSLGLLPDKVSLLLQTKGMDSTLADLLAVQAQIARVPNGKTIKVDSLSDGAQQKLRQLGFTVKTVPGTRQITITAPTDRARKGLDALITKMGQTPGSKHVAVSAPTAAAIASLQAVQAQIRATPGAKRVTVSAPTAAAIKDLQALGFQVTRVPGSKNVTITIPTGGPSKAVSAIQGRINSLQGKTISIFTTFARKPTSWDQDANGIPDAIQNPNYKGLPKANGGIVTYYANGGTTPHREQHVAQIAPAGSWRIFAEPETGGEAYIPLAASKRVRSKAVVEDVVGRFGGKVQWFADGGRTGAGARGGRQASSVMAGAFLRSQSVAAMADVVRRFDVASGTNPARTRVVDARSGGRVQVVVVREQQPLIGTMPVTVSDSSATPNQIGAEMMRNLRNAQRGGRI
ncbi:phage tail tape measure protein [Streptomyces sp. PTM05]|uniref:Phage tail tape measure protein n=1 Tax=Streptantibioticus parmotrematis TaxID=2873249 RepID=A0ABS7QNP0_9ACTN|nr:phage tail tape measure protein [Streptantibioticus parmotrematis]MBY8884788.1 phage tail tape measure protein [Streptantibioticus parmotrematis]